MYDEYEFASRSLYDAQKDNDKNHVSTSNKNSALDSLSVLIRLLPIFSPPKVKIEFKRHKHARKTSCWNQTASKTN